MRSEETRFYLVIKSTQEVLQAYLQPRADAIKELVAKLSFLPKEFEIERPSLNWIRRAEQAPPPERLVLTIRSPVGDEPPRLPTEPGDYDGIVILGAGADLGGAASDHWCPIAPGDTVFGTRSEARRLINAGALAQPQYSGQGVNVVIIDRGLNRQWIEANYGLGRYGGGWPFTPGLGDPRPAQPPGTASVADASHGLMLARNILDLAPQAILWDLPAIPPRILGLPMFLSEAQAAFDVMLPDIYRRGGNWILVNAWAIYDRRSEVPPRDYSENDRTTLHPFTERIDDALNHRLDVVFCAGNCGEFCPSARCAPTDRGPGRSIWGANAYFRALTVGAVRTDGTWIGYSSQGPGPSALGPPLGSGFNAKPDLCAPSGFCEDFDAHDLNAGTSAATGVTAGVIAALRSRWSAQVVRPEMLRMALSATARQPLPGIWNPRFGQGIMDVAAAIAVL